MNPQDPNAPDAPAYTAEERQAFDAYAAAYVSAKIGRYSKQREVQICAADFALEMLGIRKHTFGYPRPTNAEKIHPPSSLSEKLDNWKVPLDKRTLAASTPPDERPPFPPSALNAPGSPWSPNPALQPQNIIRRQFHAGDILQVEVKLLRPVKTGEVLISSMGLATELDNSHGTLWHATPDGTDQDIIVCTDGLQPRTP